MRGRSGFRSACRKDYYRQLLVSLAVVALLAGCDIPPQMQVTKGVDPENEDKDVRFRTIYYFRVFDYCEDVIPGNHRTTDDKHIFPDKGSRPLRLIKDSIYRFRMTGKASSLFSVVHFESGTLKASQIDPFGANVALNEKSGQFYFRSQDEVKAEAIRDTALADIKRYQDLRASFDKDDPLKDEVTNLIKNEIRAIGNNRAASAPASSAVRQKLEDVLRSARKDAGDGIAQALIAIDAATAAWTTAGNDIRAKASDNTKPSVATLQTANSSPANNGVNDASPPYSPLLIAGA